MRKVFCIGELLIDFIYGDVSLWTSVGANGFGLFLKKTIEDLGVDTTYMKLLEKENTTLEITLNLLISIKK